MKPNFRRGERKTNGILLRVGDPRLCTVYIGRYATNVYAASTHDAARQAIAYFLATSWKGPKPTPATVLEIAPMGTEERYRVRVANVFGSADRLEQIVEKNGK